MMPNANVRDRLEADFDFYLNTITEHIREAPSLHRLPDSLAHEIAALVIAQASQGCTSADDLDEYLNRRAEKLAEERLAHLPPEALADSGDSQSEPADTVSSFPAVRPPRPEPEGKESAAPSLPTSFDTRPEHARQYHAGDAERDARESAWDASSDDRVTLAGFPGGTEPPDQSPLPVDPRSSVRQHEPDEREQAHDGDTPSKAIQQARASRPTPAGTRTWDAAPLNDDLAQLSLAGFPNNPKRAARLCITALADELGLDPADALATCCNRVAGALATIANEIAAHITSPYAEPGPGFRREWQRVARRESLRAVFESL